MDPLSAFINDDFPLTTLRQQNHHSDRQTATKQAAAGRAVADADAGFRMASNNTLSIAAETETASSVPPGTLSMDPADDADSDSKLSPVSSPRAASPYQPTTPMDVPCGSNGSSNVTTAAAQAAQHQVLLHAGAEVSTPSRHVQDSPGMPPLSPPDPDINPEVLEQLLQKASPAITDNRFSMSDFLKNKAAMTAAARRELAGGADHTLHGPAVGGDDITTSLEDAGHAADLARQAAHLNSLTGSVAEESKVNRELAGLLLERLESSKRAVECLMRLLTCLMEAEAAYSIAMSSAAKTASAGPLTAPSDSSNLAAALEGMVALPAAAAAGHRQLYLELQVLTDAAKSLWRRYSAKAKELKQSVHMVQRGIDGCCKQLMATLSDHKAACYAFDAAVVWQAPSSNTGSPEQNRHRRTLSTDSTSSGSRSHRGSWADGGSAGVAAAAAALRPRFRTAPTQDPWCTEGKLLAEQQALKRWQDQERELLQQGYGMLQVLETERVADLLKAGQTLAASYPAAVQTLPPAAEDLRGRLGGLGGAGEVGLQSLAKVAAEMRATSEALALRQSESLAVLQGELFCSPDIIRQGSMELWDARNSRWCCCHFVLTRAGFLHWFKNIESTTPLEPPLNLSKCEFEAGQAPAFNLVEAGSGNWLMGRSGRKVTLKASSIEECCEWAIALRESIALSSSAGGASISRSGSGIPSRH